MGYDLDIMPQRGELLSADEANRLLEQFCAETDLDGPCEITTCDIERTDSDAFDLKRLEECFEDGEFSRSEFKAFGESHQIELVAGEQCLYRAASLFQDYKWGQSLFVLKLPHHEDEVLDAYRKIVDFARRHNLIVHDPQSGCDIDLDSPSDLPSMWR
jgi:hypothetical protein